MKRILLFIIAVFAVNSVISQSLLLSDASGPVSNGAIINVYGSCDSSKIEVKIKVTNNSANTLTIKVKKIINDTITGSKNTFCFAGQCFGSNTYTSPLSVTFGSIITDSSFGGDYSPKGFSGTSSITYVFYDIDNINDSAWATVNFIAAPASITESSNIKYEISNPFPNPARNFTVFNYKLSGTVNDAKFMVRDLLGNIVLQEPIFDLQGKLTIDISSLNSGIYLYSFVINNKPVTAKKLIIQH
jgi:hypothetical protein